MVVLLLWYTIRAVFYGVATASQLDVLEWPVALSAFVLKIVFVVFHFLLAWFLYYSAHQRAEAKLRVWFYIRLFIGILVFVLFGLELFHILFTVGINVYSILIISIIASWICFMIYSLLVGRWLINEIEHDYLVARNMYRFYSGRNP
ncbi:unnamed protein product [Orchesella dallaii]